jgi:circadian clock protein KaiB
MTIEPKVPSDNAALEQALEAAQNSPYVLRLYVIGTTPQSMRAVTNIRRVCEEHLFGRYSLEVVDLTENPAIASGEQIFAAPTLVKKMPLPLRRFIGDLSRTDRLLLGLDLLHP